MFQSRDVIDQTRYGIATAGAHATRTLTIDATFRVKRVLPTAFISITPKSNPLIYHIVETNEITEVRPHQSPYKLSGTKH